MELSAPTILRCRVRIPGIYAFQIDLSFKLQCEKNEYKQKEAWFGPLNKNSVKQASTVSCLNDPHFKNCAFLGPFFFISVVSIQLINTVDCT